jgi:maltooligosyltrehalose trehalohydrolase
LIDDPEVPPFGVRPIERGKALWRVWAPHAERAELVLVNDALDRRVAMTPEPRGFHCCRTPLPEQGQRYAYALDGKSPLPDPCARWQPDGVLRPSAVWFPERWPWNEGTWRGVERSELVFYELHVGTFTKNGTFEAVIERLAEIHDLGITAIELMPIGQFSGTRGWGYDGVHPFAPHASYGGPQGLHRLVEACHRAGLAVFLDVVGNHFGPEGNVFPAFGHYLTDSYRTGWGAAVNYDDRGCDMVRAMVLENARSWVRDYHVDGLRLDATHQFFDRSPRHILAEIVEVVHSEADRLGRTAHVFAETDMNDAPRFLNPPERGGHGFDGQWNDDFHHASHVVLTGERAGYYADFHGPADLAKAYERVFVNDGGFSAFFGRRHGGPATQFSGDRFVAFIQNHDQVGNRLRGDRLAASLPASALRLAAGLLLLSPRLPLLFMGEEYGETRPFPFFCDFEDQPLAEAVRKGRKAEFAAFGWLEEPPDPLAQATRDSAVLSWSWQDPQRSGLRMLYRDLLRLRRSCSALRCFDHGHARLPGDPETPAVLELSRGGVAPGERALTILFNLTSQEQPLPADTARAEPTFRSEVERYGGPGNDADLGYPRLRPHEFALFGPLGE